MKNPNKISIQAFAKLANLSARRVYQLVQDGALPALKDSMLPRDETISALFKYYQRDPLELKREKLLLAAATRKLKEGELDVMEKTTIDRAVAEHTFRASMRKYHSIVREATEHTSPARRLEKLRELGAGQEILQPFYEFDVKQSQGVTDMIEAQCKKIANEGAEKLEP